MYAKMNIVNFTYIIPNKDPFEPLLASLFNFSDDTDLSELDELLRLNPSFFELLLSSDLKIRY